MSNMTLDDLVPCEEYVREQEYLREKRYYLRRIGKAKEELEVLAVAATHGRFDELKAAPHYLREIDHCRKKLQELEDKDENILIEFNRYAQRWDHDNTNGLNAWHNTFQDYGENAEFTDHKKLKAQHEERRNWKHKHTTNRRTSSGR